MRIGQRGLRAGGARAVGAECRFHRGALRGEQTAQARERGTEALVDGTLVVRTDSTAWATELKLLAPNLVKRLNAELGDGTVLVVEVLGPNAPSWKHGRLGLRGGRGPRDTYG